MAEDSRFINFNGINKTRVHEHTDKNGKPFYSISITPVPYSVSKDGYLNIKFNDKDEYNNRVRECKSDAGKVNLGFPKTDSKGNAWTIPAGNVSICTYKDDEGKKVYQSLADIAKKKGEGRLAELFGENSFEKYTRNKDGEEETFYSLKVSAIQDKVIEARKAIKGKAAEAPAVEAEEDGPELG